MTKSSVFVLSAILTLSFSSAFAREGGGTVGSNAVGTSVASLMGKSARLSALRIQALNEGRLADSRAIANEQMKIDFQILEANQTTLSAIRTQTCANIANGLEQTLAEYRSATTAPEKRISAAAYQNLAVLNEDCK